MNEGPRDPRPEKTLDEKLSAYLLGEADVTEAREVREALAADPALREREAELRRTLALLRTPGAKPALDEERRAALRAAARREAAPRGRLLSFPAMRAAAALLLFGGVVTLARFGWPGGEAAADGATAAAPESRAAEGRDFADAGAGDVGASSAPEAKPDPTVGALVEQESAPVESEPAPKRFGEALEQLGYGGGGGFHGPSDSVPPGAPPMELGLRSAVKQSLGGVAGGPVGGRPGAGAAARDGRRDDAFSGFVGRVQTTPPPEDPATAGAEERTRRFDQPGANGYVGDVDVELRDELDAGIAAPQPRCVVVDGYGRRYVDAAVLEHLRPHRGKESPRAMFFRFYGDNPVVPAEVDAMSTFAADVDTASYPLARNYLVNGHLPPRQAVRTEEFVNYFDHELAPPAEGDFALHLEAAPSRFGDGRHLLRVGIKAREVERAERKPLHLVFVIDKSGSMARENRIELVQDALELLVDQVRDDDSIGIVAFDSEGHEVLEPTRGADRWEIRQAIRGLTTGGSTNAAEGLFLGYAMAERAYREDAINRVVLASDGVANTGETDQERILEKVRASAEVDVDLTTLGVGMGNHNDVFLEQLADQGDGSCHYVDDFAEARRVLVDGFTGVMQTVARDVKIQVEFDRGTVSEWRQLGYENRSLRHEDFRDDAVDAGEVGAGHEVVGLYELALAGAAADSGDAGDGDSGDAGDALVTVRLRWFPDGADEAVEMESTLRRGDLRSRWALASPHFRLAGVAAQYAEVLRRSVHARGDGYDALRAEADALARELASRNEVRELRDMIDRTERLARWSPAGDELSRLIEECRRGRLLEARLLQREQDEEIRKMLAQVRRQNERLERRLEEMLR